MLSILISLVAAVVSTALLKLAFVRSRWELIFPFLVVLVGVMALLFRRTATMLEPLIKGAEKHLMAGRREQAMKALRDGLGLGRWNPLVPPQLRVQIGTLEYALGHLDEAEVELKRAWRWPWQSRAYLGCVYFKKRDGAKMEKAFETAVAVGKKEGLAWATYAWCLVAQGKRAEAVKVLERGLKEIPNDHRLESNLELARKPSEKLKMAPYGDTWAAFALETAGPVLPKAARGFAVRPGFRQRPMRRK